MSEPLTTTPYRAPANDGGEIIPESEAKQGRRGYHVLAVLVASVALVLAAFAVIFTLHVHTPTDSTPAAKQANTHAVASGAAT